VVNAAKAIMKNLDLQGVSPDLIIRGSTVENETVRRYLDQHLAGGGALLDNESFRRALVGAANEQLAGRSPAVLQATEQLLQQGRTIFDPAAKDPEPFRSLAALIATTSEAERIKISDLYAERGGPNPERMALLLRSGADSVKVLEMRAALLGEDPMGDFSRAQSGLTPEQLGRLAGGYQHIFGVAVEDPRMVALRQLQGEYGNVVRKQYQLATGAWKQYEEIERQREDLPWIERSLFGKMISNQDGKLYEAGDNLMAESERLRAHGTEMSKNLSASRRQQQEALDLGAEAAELLKAGKTELAKQKIAESNRALAEAFETLGNPRLLVQTDQNREDMKKLVAGLDSSIQAWDTTETVLRTTRTVLICTAAGLATGGIATGAMGFGAIATGGTIATYGTVAGTGIAMVGGTAVGATISTLSVGTENTIHVAQGTKTVGQAAGDAGSEIWEHTKDSAKSALLAGGTVGATSAFTKGFQTINKAASSGAPGALSTGQRLIANVGPTGQRLMAGAGGGFASTAAVDGTAYGIKYVRAQNEFESLMVGQNISDEERDELWQDIAKRNGVGEGSVRQLVANIGVNTVGNAAGMHFGSLRQGATGFTQHAKLAAGEAAAVGSAEIGAMFITDGRPSVGRMVQAGVSVALGEMANHIRQPHSRGPSLAPESKTDSSTISERAGGTTPQGSLTAQNFEPGASSGAQGNNVGAAAAAQGRLEAGSDLTTTSTPRRSRTVGNYNPGIPVGAQGGNIVGGMPELSSAQSRFDVPVEVSAPSTPRSSRTVGNYDPGVSVGAQGNNLIGTMPPLSPAQSRFDGSIEVSSSNDPFRVSAAPDAPSPSPEAVRNVDLEIDTGLSVPTSSITPRRIPRSSNFRNSLVAYASLGLSLVPTAAVSNPHITVNQPAGNRITHVAPAPAVSEGLTIQMPSKPTTTTSFAVKAETSAPVRAPVSAPVRAPVTHTIDVSSPHQHVSMTPQHVVASVADKQVLREQQKEIQQAIEKLSDNTLLKEEPKRPEEDGLNPRRRNRPGSEDFTPMLQKEETTSRRAITEEARRAEEIQKRKEEEARKRGRRKFTKREELDQWGNVVTGGKSDDASDVTAGAGKFIEVEDKVRY
jgi:hypothetical protein